MKATVNLDDALYRQVKIKAAEDGVTVTSIFERALQRYLSLGIETPGIQDSPGFDIPTLDGTGGLMPGIDLNDSAELQRVSDSDLKLEQLR